MFNSMKYMNSKYKTYVFIPHYSIMNNFANIDKYYS